MAFFRSIVNRSNLLRHKRRSPVFAYSSRDVDRDNSSWCRETFVEGREFSTQGYSKFFVSSNRFCGSSAIGFVRNMSSLKERLDIDSGATPVADGLEFADVFKDSASVLADVAVQAVSSHTPAVSEIAVAAADCYFPVAALQYLIDAVRYYAGVNWWAAIVLTTLLIRGLTIPLLINQLRASHKLSIIRPRLEEIRDNAQGLPVKETQKEMAKVFKEAGVTPFSPLKGILFQAPIFMSFFFAITNMTEKVSSMKTGGAYWFVDLTTPDSLYILPALTGLTFWITVECNAQEGMEGNAHAATMKNVSRLFAAASIPLTMNFPKAIFFYWVTSTMFSLSYGLVLKNPKVKKALGIPVAPPSSTAAQPSFDLLGALKQAKGRSEEPSKSSEQKVSAVLSQRIRTLEKQVKGKRKNKHR